jgi:hypothetical protein
MTPISEQPSNNLILGFWFVDAWKRPLSPLGFPWFSDMWKTVAETPSRVDEDRTVG